MVCQPMDVVLRGSMKKACNLFVGYLGKGHMDVYTTKRCSSSKVEVHDSSDYKSIPLLGHA